MGKDDKLYITAANVFANLVFLTPIENNLKNENEFLNFKIDFTGEKNGYMIMKIEKNLLEYINSIISDDKNDIKECGKEILNIICGNILSETFTDKKRFKLSPPIFVEKLDIDAYNFSCSTKIFFEEGSVYLYCNLNK
ncbi:MAG: chemotaxis protein CheX [Elusimicrobiales bacterium]|nr:chemotaxis protein CheX [Elusimicrobiales bacterium]